MGGPNDRDSGAKKDDVISDPLDGDEGRRTLGGAAEAIDNYEDCSPRDVDSDGNSTPSEQYALSKAEISVFQETIKKYSDQAVVKEEKCRKISTKSAKLHEETRTMKAAMESTNECTRTECQTVLQKCKMYAEKAQQSASQRTSAELVESRRFCHHARSMLKVRNELLQIPLNRKQ